MGYRLLAWSIELIAYLLALFIWLADKSGWLVRILMAVLVYTLALIDWLAERVWPEGVYRKK